MSIVEERYSKWLNHKNLAPQYIPAVPHSILQLNSEQQVCVVF